MSTKGKQALAIVYTSFCMISVIALGLSYYQELAIDDTSVVRDSFGKSQLVLLGSQISYACMANYLYIILSKVLLKTILKKV